MKYFPWASMVMFVSGASLLFWHYLEARGLQLRPSVHYETVAHIPLPAGYKRIPQEAGSFGSWLRRIPLFIRGGSPGHAVLVMDMVENAAGQKIFLLAQSYMPAQDIHILKSPGNSFFPWYHVASIDKLIVTPEWGVKTEELMRFR